MRIVYAIDLNPRAVLPGDALLDIKNRIHLVISVITDKDGTHIAWFKDNKISSKTYTHR